MASHFVTRGNNHRKNTHAPINPHKRDEEVRMAKLDITVISDPGKFDGFYFLQGLMNVGEGYATNVASMVKYVLMHVKSEDDTIMALTIHGHGNGDGQYIGTDWLDSTLYLAYKEELAKLTNHFDKDAVVTLGGCNVGHADNLLKLLSQLWGDVIVRAGTAQQLAFPGLEGGVKSCRVNICSGGEPGFWDKFDRYIRRDKRFLK